MQAEGVQIRTVTIFIYTVIRNFRSSADGIISRLAARAIEMDGTCTGEHGIGQGKQKYMQQEHGNALALMHAIKSALDPKNILNPGKIWPETLPTN